MTNDFYEIVEKSKIEVSWCMDINVLSMKVVYIKVSSQNGRTPSELINFQILVVTDTVLTPVSKNMFCKSTVTQCRIVTTTKVSFSCDGRFRGLGKHLWTTSSHYKYDRKNSPKYS